MQTPAHQNSQVVSTVWAPAGFWIRALAYIIDSIFIALITLPLNKTYETWIKENSFVYFAIMLAIWGLYGSLCYIWLKGTIGKKILNLRVIDYERKGDVAFWVIFFRDGFGRFISGLPLGFGFYWAAFNKEKKTLHDHIFATRVVKRVSGEVLRDEPSPLDAVLP